MPGTLVMIILTLILFGAAYMLPAASGLLIVCGLLAAAFTGLMALTSRGKGN